MVEQLVPKPKEIFTISRGRAYFRRTAIIDGGVLWWSICFERIKFGATCKAQWQYLDQFSRWAKAPLPWLHQFPPSLPRWAFQLFLVVQLSQLARESHRCTSMHHEWLMTSAQSTKPRPLPWFSWRWSGKTLWRCSHFRHLRANGRGSEHVMFRSRFPRKPMRIKSSQSDEFKLAHVQYHKRFRFRFWLCNQWPHLAIDWIELRRIEKDRTYEVYLTINGTNLEISPKGTNIRKFSFPIPKTLDKCALWFKSHDSTHVDIDSVYTTDMNTPMTIIVHPNRFMVTWNFERSVVH